MASNTVAAVAPVFSLHFDGHTPGELESAPPPLRHQAKANADRETCVTPSGWDTASHSKTPTLSG